MRTKIEPDGHRVGTILGLLLVASSAIAQDDPAGGVLLQLQYSERLVRTDDLFESRSVANLALSSRTRRQSLDLTLGGTAARILDDGDVETEFRDPSAALGYRIASARSALSLDFGYSESDVDSLVFLDLLDLLFLDEGTRTTSSGNVGFEFGIGAPFGGSVDLGLRQTRFTDTVDPDLVDQDAISANLSLRFVIDPRVTATTTASLAELDRDDGTGTATRSLSAGVDVAATKLTQIGARVGYTEVVRETDETTEGLTAGIDVTRELQRGTLSFGISRDVDDAGARTSFDINRALDLPRGNLAVSAGLSQQDNGDLLPVVGLSFGTESRRASLSVTIEQAFSANADGDAVQNSRISANYNRRLTETATLSAGLAVAVTDELQDDGNDRERISASLGYSQALTEDWSLAGNVTLSRSRETLQPDEETTELSVGLQRTFSWRP